MTTQRFHIPAALDLEIEISLFRDQMIQAQLQHSKAKGIACEVKEGSLKTVQRIEEWLHEYALKKRQPTVSLPLSLEGLPPFISRALWALHEVPFGQTLSYGEMAAHLHNPKAARAVGQACGRNPLILFIPCHRILAANQKLGGFSSDPSLKPLLLGHESVQLA